MRRLLLGLFSFLLSFSIFASEDSIYDFSWLDQDKEVYVLQNRKYRKAKKFKIGATLGKQLNGAFIDSFNFDLYASYFFKEDWGFEISYTSASGDENDTHDAVNLQGAVAYYRKIETAMSVMAMWAPFYAKINTFNKVFYYDWLIGFGLSSVATADNRNRFINISNTNLTKETVMGLTWMTGLHFYISKAWSTRIDFRAFHLNADKAGGSPGSPTSEKKFSHYYNINFGLNYTF